MENFTFKCAVSHCERVANSNKPGAYCESHYQFNYRGIDPETRLLRSEVGRVDVKCWVDYCPKRASQKGLCNGHAGTARRGELKVPESLGLDLNPPCAFPDCPKLTESRKRDYCRIHTNHINRFGAPGMARDWGVYTSGEVLCLLDGCEKSASAMGLCPNHASLRTKYKLTVEEFLELKGATRCSNSGCSNTTRLHIDHDHKTGKVRGLLCNGCNSALGMLGESVERMRGLIAYKELHG